MLNLTRVAVVVVAMMVIASAACGVAPTQLLEASGQTADDSHIQSSFMLDLGSLSLGAGVEQVDCFFVHSLPSKLSNGQIIVHPSRGLARYQLTIYRVETVMDSSRSDVCDLPFPPGGCSLTRGGDASVGVVRNGACWDDIDWRDWQLLADWRGADVSDRKIQVMPGERWMIRAHEANAAVHEVMDALILFMSTNAMDGL